MILQTVLVPDQEGIILEVHVPVDILTEQNNMFVSQVLQVIWAICKR